MAENMYTVAEVAAHLKLAIRTVREYILEGRIKGVKVGKEWRVPDSDLQGYIDRLKAARNGKAQ
jgi:excisionase family DNA binding protein